MRLIKLKEDVNSLDPNQWVAFWEAHNYWGDVNRSTDISVKRLKDAVPEGKMKYVVLQGTKGAVRVINRGGEFTRVLNTDRGALDANIQEMKRELERLGAQFKEKNNSDSKRLLFDIDIDGEPYHGFIEGAIRVPKGQRLKLGLDMDYVRDNGLIFPDKRYPGSWTRLTSVYADNVSTLIDQVRDMRAEAVRGDYIPEVGYQPVED